MNEQGEVLCKQYQLSKGNPIADTKELLAKIKAFALDQGATLEVIGFGATGYAADVLQESLRADANIVETVAHMMAAVKYFGTVDVICDIGGQDIKVMKRIEPRELAIEGVITRHGTLVGPLMAELTGFPELTPYDGGWCGRKSPPVRIQAFNVPLAAACRRSGCASHRHRQPAEHPSRHRARRLRQRQACAV